MSVVAVLATGLLALTACGDGGRHGSSSTNAAPPETPLADPPISRDPIVATPSEAQPGQLVELTFPTELQRGAPWYMSKWDGEDWTKPLYLVISSSDGYNADGPTWHPRSEEWGWHDIGFRGSGPDTVVVPDEADPGAYRLCTANTGKKTYCVNLTVSSVKRGHA